MKARKKIIAVSLGRLVLISGIGFARAGESDIKSISAVAEDLIQKGSVEKTCKLS